MHDSGLEDRLRTTFRAEGDGLHLTITAAELERRLTTRRRSRAGRRMTLLAAAVAVVAVAGITAMSNGWLGLPAIGAHASPASTVSPSASEPIPSDPNGPAAFTPPEMQVASTLLGQPVETLVLTTDCSFTYTLADGRTGDGGCVDDPDTNPVCCETLSMPWGADLAVSMPDGWVMTDTVIDATARSWVEDLPAGTKYALGWTRLGDDEVRIHSTFSDGHATYVATYRVPVHGPTTRPVVPAPAVPCGPPDLSATTPPAVRLYVDGVPMAIGEFRSRGWNGSDHFDATGLPSAAAVPVSSDAALELRIDGDVCANLWHVVRGVPPTTSMPYIQRVGSLVLTNGPRADAPGTDLANRFSLATLPAGEWWIEADLQYVDGSAQVAWHVIVK